MSIQCLNITYAAATKWSVTEYNDAFFSCQMFSVCFFAKDVSPVAFIDRLDYEKKNSHRTDIHFSNEVEKIFIENIYTLLNVGLALMT